MSDPVKAVPAPKCQFCSVRAKWAITHDDAVSRWLYVCGLHVHAALLELVGETAWPSFRLRVWKVS